MKVADGRQCIQPAVPLPELRSSGTSAKKEDDRLLDHIIGCEMCMSVIVDLSRPANACAQECPTLQTLIANSDVDAPSTRDELREWPFAATTYHM
jgi:hypothetical protein